jgi:hypothetical protein
LPNHYDLLAEKNAKFQWTNECEAAFKSLKQHLTKTPTLAYPDFQKPFILDTDASNIAIGGVLSQVVAREHARTICVNLYYLLITCKCFHRAPL